MATSLDKSPTLKEILFRHELEEKDLERECPRDTRRRIAAKIIDWKMVGYYLEFSPEKLAAIDRENYTEDQRKVVLLDSWGKREGRGASFLKLADALHRRERADLVELLCKDVSFFLNPKQSDGDSSSGRELQYSSLGVDINIRIDTLQNQFRDLHRQLISELKKKGVSVERVLEELTWMPIQLKNEYERTIQRMLPALEKMNQITTLMNRLNPLFTFIDYGLLEHLISNLGGEELKEDMTSYVERVTEFMRVTTVGEIIDYFPGEAEPHVDYSKLQVKFKDDPKTYTLERLNNFRRKFCSTVRLSKFIFGLISLESSESFFATWLFPTVVVSELKKAVREIDQLFCEVESIVSITVDQEQLYPLPSTVPLSQFSGAGPEMVHQHFLWQKEEKECQLPSGRSKSTIQLEKQKMREKIDISRSRKAVQLMAEHSLKEIKKEKRKKKSGAYELPGVEACDETNLVVTNSAQLFEWKEYQLKLHISEETLPPGTDQCIISIKVSTNGQYQLPKGFHLVSAVFWLHCQPMCKFAKSITVEMEHCTKLENLKKLTFLKGVSDQRTFLLAFEKITSTCTFGRYWGSVELNGFSGVAIALDEGSEENKSDQLSNEREYAAMVFHTPYQRVTSYMYRIDFVVTWNTEAHLTPVKKEYKEKGAKLDSELIVEFESESITVDIPLEGIVIEGGWKIRPLSPPVVLKQLVDSYEEGKLIPKCQFAANIMLQREENIHRLEHRVKLVGAKFPFNSLLFYIRPPSLYSRSYFPRKSKQLSNLTSSDRKTRIRDEITAAKPNLSNMMAFKWKDTEGKIQKFRLRSHIYHKWQDIGTSAELPFPWFEVLRTVKDAKYCCDVVLRHWLEHPTPQYPATWEGLYELLDDCELGEVMNQLRRAVENAV